MNLEQNNIDKNKEESTIKNTEELSTVEVEKKEALKVDDSEETSEVLEAKSDVEEKEISEEPKEVEAKEDSNESDSSIVDDALSYYQKLVEKTEEFLKSNDWSYISNEFSNQALQLEDAPESISEESKALLKKYNSLKADFDERKQKHYEELNKKREDNLAKKKALLKDFADIITEEKWGATKEVGHIAGKWESIKQIPQSEVEALNSRFKSLMDEFESHKVDRLVKKLQKEEENLTLKLLLIDKMKNLNTQLSQKGADFEALSKSFDDLLIQWRKVGRVPTEKNEGLWDSFNKVQDDFNSERLKNDASYRKTIEKALEKKQKLIEEAEALVDEKNLAEAARQVNKLHKLWKKTKNLPQKDENELWDKFKAATDSFNEKKSENLDVLRDQEQQNLDKKLALIKKAEEAKDIANYEQGHKMMQDLMEEWKNIGPVPRKKSSKIWNKFKGAMDAFYEQRRNHFKDVRSEQKENLTVKKEIIEKIAALGTHEDPALAIDEAKKLQEDFKNAGHVPLKFKNKIWKQYREACDVVYERSRALGADLGMEKKLAREGVEPGDRKKVVQLQKEAVDLKKFISRLEAEVIQYKEAQTYFKPTSKGNILKDELQAKIEKGEKVLEEKIIKLNKIDREISDLKQSGD